MKLRAFRRLASSEIALTRQSQSIDRTATSINRLTSSFGNNVPVIECTTFRPRTIGAAATRKF